MSLGIECMNHVSTNRPSQLSGRSLIMSTLNVRSRSSGRVSEGLRGHGMPHIFPLASSLLLGHRQHCNLGQSRPNQLPHLHLQHQLYYTKGREEKSGRGRLNLRRQAGWQSRNLANKTSGVIGLGLFRANPMSRYSALGTSEVNIYIRSSL
jgi:hypothetical protein